MPASPHGLLDGRGGAWPFDFFAAGFLAFSFTTFFAGLLAAVLDFALAFFFVAIVSSF
ncbi:MAG TPA: hypothetical protein VMC05_12805 [Xanthobacteraceae bacterium]|nr:hypothetical protein [Xanthobacteraceae bacterium]